jgi:curli biogenesis system outer membrane secretion channel CsgG
MIRFTLAASVVALAAALSVGAMTTAGAQTAEPKKAAAKASPKAGPGMKVCTYKFPTGEKRQWTCEKAQPCCAWDQINYTKCGSTITGCL